MKLISDDLINDVQVLIDNAIHLRHTWSQVAQVKQALAGLDEYDDSESEEDDC